MNYLKPKNDIVKIVLLLLGISVAITALWSCQTQRNYKFSAPVLTDLGNHKLSITTDSHWAQKFFNQGLTLAYAFNHREAARAFKEAVNQDPECAMCYWGLALVQGPNINAPMDPAGLGEVYLATSKALRLSAQATSWERDLIKALSYRYPDSTTVDRAPLDSAYAAAMEKVYEQYPHNQDVAVLYGESLMDLHPWDLYEKNGTPKSWTPKIVQVLENILRRWPQHPGANHLYIHAVEASTSPERAMEAANRLRDLVPGAGHLVHMPSHIYIRTGKYHQGSIANQQAIKADSIYVSACNAQGIYPLLYYPHNIHFLAATAALEGRGDISINAAFQLANRVDQDLMQQPEWSTLQHYYTIPFYVMVKFGQWDRILDLPLEAVPYPQAVLHYARGMAFANKGQLIEANNELARIEKIRSDSVLKGMMIWDLNKVSDLVEIAALVLKAEILGMEGAYDQAIALLEKAVQIEDNLTYTEPPDWFFSVRHSLGNMQLLAGYFQQAEQVYGEDLARLPENGWALNGLYLSLSKQHKNIQAAQVKRRFDKAWQYANIELKGSVISHLSYNSYQDLDLFNDQLALASLDKIPLCGKPI